jgi:hypothetical protein
LADPEHDYEYFDRINVSLVSNSLNNPRYHRALKSQVKLLRKEYLESRTIGTPLREFSWLRKVMKNISENPLRDTHMARMITLLQTRASGFPDDSTVRESFLKWKGVVTKEPPTDSEVDIRFVRALAPLLRETTRVNAFTIGHTHVSLGASACLESPRKRISAYEGGGKTGMAARLIQSNVVTSEICLESGKLTRNLIHSRNRTGDFLLHLSLRRYLEDPESLLPVRVSSVHEWGEKSRIITVPSFYHSSILSPWAHLTYQMLKTSQEAAGGVMSANHGWRFSLEMTASNPKLDWLFRPEIKVGAALSDLESATDNAYFCTIEAVLREIQEVLRVPEWYFSVVVRLLSSSRPFSSKFENLIRGTSVRGVFMGDHGSKTVLTCSGLIALEAMPVPRLSALVGDDHVTVSPDPARCLKIYRERMERMGYVLSEQDTLISDHVFLAEEVTAIPRDASKTTEVWTMRKTGKGPLPFVDYPPVKILSDGDPGNGYFSSNVVGKISLLGKKMQYSSGTLSFGQFHLASWIQDLCMSNLSRPEFVYFPAYLVSTGKPILFDHDSNFSRFLRMQRKGKMAGYYGRLMKAALLREDTGKRISNNLLNHRGTEVIRVFDKFPLGPEFENNLILRSPAVRAFCPYLVGRLRKKIISETEIQMKLVERENLFGDPLPTLPRLTVLSLVDSTSPLTDELLTEFIGAWRSNSKLLRLGSIEKYYDREAVENLLGESYPLRVSGLTNNLKYEEQKEILNLERDREVQKLWDWVKTNPNQLDDIPRELIRDDIIISCSKLTDSNMTGGKLLMVSNDIKLVRYIATLRSFNWRKVRETYHISIENWVLADLTSSTYRDPVDPSKPFFSEDEVFVDLGSLDGYIDIMDSKGLEIPEPDGAPIAGRINPIRPTGELKIPPEVSDYLALRQMVEEEDSKERNA